MKKILMLIPSLEGGGAERVVLSLGKKMREMGHAVHIILLSKKCDFVMDSDLSIHDFELPIKRKISRCFFYRTQGLRLREFVKDILSSSKLGHFDLILSNNKCVDKLLGFADLPNSYFCIHNTMSEHLKVRGRGIKWYLNKRKYKSIYNNKNIIAVSNGVAKDFVENVGVKPKSIQVIYNPVDLVFIKKQSELNIDIPYKNYIIHVGRFEKVKRHDLLLKAFAESGLECKLILLGKGSDEYKIRQLIKDLDLGDKVVLAGFQANPYPWLKKAKFLVLSSDYEGFSLVIAEALACGTPVVSTNCASGPEEILIGDLQNGLVPVDNISELAKKMRDFYYSEITVDTKTLKRFKAEDIAEQYLALVDN